MAQNVLQVGDDEVLAFSKMDVATPLSRFWRRRVKSSLFNSSPVFSYSSAHSRRNTLTSTLIYAFISFGSLGSFFSASFSNSFSICSMLILSFLVSASSANVS